MDLEAINKAIKFGNFTTAELATIGNAILFRRSQLTRKAVCSTFPGDSVSFRSLKSGVTHHGKVEKIGRKFITVRTSNGLWRVPGSMIETV